MIKKLVLSTMLLSITVPALASNWASVATLNSGTLVELDTSSIHKDAGHHAVTIWTRMTYANASVATSEHNAGVKVTKTHWLMQCDARRVKPLSVLASTEDGSSVASGDVPNAAFFDVAPDTITEQVFNTACADF